MIRNRILRILALLLSGFMAIFHSCAPVKKPIPVVMESFFTDTLAINTQPGNSTLLYGLLQAMPASFLSLLKNPDAYRMQIIYTQIDRDGANKPYFKHHYFNVTDQYTYPASTVKLPAAVLALEKMNQLAIDGLTLYTPMFTDPLRPAEKPVYDDASSKTGKPSIAHYIKKILLVSDNDAHNRLYEFLGQASFNKRLHDLGLTQSQMTHRLSIALTEQENRTTNPVWFMDANGKTIYRQPFGLSKMAYAPRTDIIGKGYMKGGGPGMDDVLVNEPLDFSTKNRWPLMYAHQLTQWLMFPESQPAESRLLLTPYDYTFLWKYMSMLPGESNFPAYADPDYWPTYVKFLMTGSEKGAWPLKDVRIFNKVGDAYGHLLDAAYVADFGNKVEFLLSAVIYCNNDGILNDDKYDYDAVGFPFMKALGKLIYDYELKRERKYRPDLSRYQFNYTEN